jgi:uncharacterized protein YprB with RNaseH-like and TPR domain
VDLKKRLAQLDRLSRRPEAAAPPPATASVESSLEELRLVRTETPSGPVWLRRYRDELVLPGGSLPDLSGFFPRATRFGPAAENLLFLDTETTGLAGGTGTIPFLVGVAWWDQGFLNTQQYFLPDPGQEVAMLQDLARLARGFSAVVTFNGASFDLPLVRTRARLNRLPDPLATLVSWDLLVPSRRLYGNRLPDCRQQTLEENICGLERASGDIDGSRIPQTWFDFLANGQVGLLPRVLSHNRRDMVGMGSLFRNITRAAQKLVHDPCPVQDLDWREGWALGRICERRRAARAALACLVWAVGEAPHRPGSGFGDPRFVADAVRILKRGRDWHLVEQVIQGGLTAGLDEPWLHREAAILYEHRLVDMPKALDHARKSGEDHRVKRLQDRIS